MPIKLPEEVEREHEKTRRQMLAAEAALFLALRRSAKQAIPDAAGRFGTRGIVAGSRLVESLTEAVYLGRRAARDVSTMRLRSELLAIGADDIADDMVRTRGLSVALDRGRAVQAVRNVTNKLIRRLTSDDSKRSVLSGESFGFRRIAATETADAFGNERRAALSGLRSRVLLYRMWDATLDRRTCPTCRAADGTAVPLGQPFPHGTPGSVHVLCRCIETILPVEMLNEQKSAA